MTRNQIAYQELLEKGRSNRAQETEANRSNLAREAENNRANLAKERELNRHQLETEAQGRAGLEETARSNRAKESLTKYSTDVGAEQKALDRLNAAQIASSNRMSQERIATSDRDLKRTLGEWAQDLNEYTAYEQAKTQQTQRDLNAAKTDSERANVQRNLEKSNREERQLQSNIVKQMYDMDLDMYDRNPIVRLGDAFTRLVPSVNYKLGGSSK